jgi:hypothetical protein
VNEGVGGHEGGDQEGRDAECHLSLVWNILMHGWSDGKDTHRIPRRVKS